MIELIMVIVVLGILSVSASSLFTSKSSYVTFIAKDQLLSMSLLAQQAALAQQDQTIVMCIRQTTSEWWFEVRKNDCDPTEDANLYVLSKAERANASLTQNGTSFSSPQTFIFDKSAGLSSANIANNKGNVTFLFDGDADETVCLSSTGYAYAEACKS